MKFAFRDLGRQEEGSTVVVRLRGSAANVILLDAKNFAHYRAGAPFIYDAGGCFRSSPVRLQVPRTDHWYVVVDLAGFRGRVRASVEVIPKDADAPAQSNEPLVQQS